ncbi:MAG: M23 family metallopeptidase [Bacteroidota bacterium]
MPADQHHTSKKNQYTIVLVPNEDASKSRNYRFAPWHVVTALLAIVVLVSASVLSLIVFTRVGTFLPISNPELENKYSKELISLNDRMAGLIEQMVELRAYNVKLRQALGESVVNTDSGVVKLADSRQKQNQKIRQEESRMPAPIVHVERATGDNSSQVYATTFSEDPSPKVSFPAVLPTQGYLTQGFDPGRGHFGLDIAGKIGTPVNAASDGYVVFSGWTHDDGYLVILSHTGGFMTFYKHNQTLLKSANQFVRRGEPIATLGNSGTTSSGPHLHFEIWKDGSPVDPTLYVLNINL